MVRPDAAAEETAVQIKQEIQLTEAETTEHTSPDRNPAKHAGGGQRTTNPLPVQLPAEVTDDAVLAATRLRLKVGESVRVIGFAGLGEIDGADALCLRMAVATARLVQGPVLIVEGDVRRSSIGGDFERTLEPGFCEVLAGAANPDAAVRATNTEHLFLLPAGRPIESTAALFSSPECRELFEALTANFRYVFVHLGPIVSSPESFALASQTDGVVATLARGRRRRNEAAELRRQIEAAGTHLLGIVLTEPEAE